MKQQQRFEHLAVTKTERQTLTTGGEGAAAFRKFADGAWPFRGKPTPKNPHDKGTEGRADWQRGYDSALTQWFMSCQKSA